MAMAWLRAPIVFTIAAAALGFVATTTTAGAAVTTRTAATVAVTGGTGAGTTAPAWSAPDPIDPAGSLKAVSCPSASFCMAADAAGNVLTYDGSSWTASFPGQGGLSSLWCTSSTFCTGVDLGGYVFTWDGSAWSRSASLADSLTSVWCGGYCFAGSDGRGGSTGGMVYRSSGSGWVPTGGPALSGGGPTFVSGLGADSIVMAIDQGEAEPAHWSVGGVGGWTTPAAIPNMFGVTALSCASQAQCLAVANGQGGNAYFSAYSAGSWTPPAPTQTPSDEVGLTAVSCVLGGLCIAGDLGGNTTTWNGGPWSAPQNVDPGGGGITGISCASATFCVAVDNDGRALIYSTALTASAVSPGQVTVGATSAPVVITGNAFTPGSPVSVTDSNPGVTFPGATAVSQTTIDATATVTPTAATGSSSVTVSQSGATSTCPNCLAVVGLSITGLSITQLAQGASHPATITGTGFYSGAKVTFTGPGKGVTATVTSVASTSISVTIKAASSAPPGRYAVTVANGLGAGRVYLPDALTVLTRPAIAALSPSAVTRGQSYFSFTITGTGFSSDATVKVPKGCHFGFATISADGTTITGSLTVTSSAPTGTNLKVIVTNGPNGGYGTATDPGLTIT
jgi:hypothetical protein